MNEVFSSSVVSRSTGMRVSGEVTLRCLGISNRTEESSDTLKRLLEQDQKELYQFAQRANRYVETHLSRPLADDTKRQQLLMHAVKSGEVTQVERWLKNNVSPNFVLDYKQETPIIVAAKSGDKRIVNLLLAHGANPEIPDPSGNTATKYINTLNAC